jgi:hypothetical protein
VLVGIEVLEDVLACVEIDVDDVEAAACVVDHADHIDLASCLSAEVLAEGALQKAFLLAEVASLRESLDLAMVDSMK